MKSYFLDTQEEKITSGSFRDKWQSLKDFYAFMDGNGSKLLLAAFFIVIDSIDGAITPFLLGIAIDKYISKGNADGLINIIIILAIVNAITLIANYVQGRIMGTISQKVLHKIRGAVFAKLQELPLAFFHQNRTGDVMSRINNDTNNLNDFLSESISRFIGSFFVLVAIAIFISFIHFSLGLVMLSMCLVLFVITKLLSPFIRRVNKKSMEANSSLNSSIQENLANFRVIAAYNKRDYFVDHVSNEAKVTYKDTLVADTANKMLEPVYEYAGYLASVGVLGYSLYLLTTGNITLGILVAFVTYTQRFYEPLLMLANIFGNVQESLAAWTRIRHILTLESNLNVLSKSQSEKGNSQFTLELKDVTFSYVENSLVLEKINLQFESGKTYALVGPTGGGKSTLVNLMSRLYDPSFGVVYLNGIDIRTYSHEERAKYQSVILQDPILFDGTVKDNIIYANQDYVGYSNEDLFEVLKENNCLKMLERFPQGLQTIVSGGGGSSMSLGQKQIISFMRVILRKPAVLILDEATANIDTVTEVLLNDVLDSLPAKTTKIIIAHRLNTIKNADEIFFVNRHHVVKAEDFTQAINLIENAKKVS